MKNKKFMKSIFLVFSLLLVFVILFSVLPYQNNFAKADGVENNINLSAEVEKIKTKADQIYLSKIDEVKNRTAGSEGEKAFANILASQMQNLNLKPYDENFLQVFSLGSSASQNVVGILDNQKENYVVIGAHLDAIFKDKSYGFHDNLSGVLGVLSLSELLIQNASSLNFNVIVCFFGAEEVGCTGSEYFIKNLDEKIKNKIMLAVNFDSIGAGENLYYFHNDDVLNYGKEIDNFAQNQNIEKLGFNKKFTTLSNLNMNQTHLGLMSDNASFLKAGVNALTLFSGDLNATNGLGYFEKQGHNKIMHNTDTAETNLNLFGDLFYENIAYCSYFINQLFTSETFSIDNFKPNQVNVISLSLWGMKIAGVIFIVLIFGVYLIIVNKKYPKKIKHNKKR